LRLLSLGSDSSFPGLFHRAFKACEHCDDRSLDAFAAELAFFAYRTTALDWFDEQARDPDLMRRRGLRSGVPLPRDLGLFDRQGRPQPIQQRAHWLRLRAWLDDEQRMLAFAFPNGLVDDEQRRLEQDLQTLKSQPWSPQAAVDAILADWPASEPERLCTREASEQRMIAACERLLAAAGQSPPS
jgi:hypothetical protein